MLIENKEEYSDSGFNQDISFGILEKGYLDDRNYARNVDEY